MAESVIITRKKYMSGPHTGAEGAANHQAYYGQFVSPSLKSAVLLRFGLLFLRDMLAQDEHLNNIQLAEWDAMAQLTGLRCAGDLRLCGDSWSLAGSVCILKEAARQLIEDATEASA